MVHRISLSNAGYSTTKHDYSHFLKYKTFHLFLDWHFIRVRLFLNSFPYTLNEWV